MPALLPWSPAPPGWARAPRAGPLPTLGCPPTAVPVAFVDTHPCGGVAGSGCALAAGVLGNAAIATCIAAAVARITASNSSLPQASNCSMHALRAALMAIKTAAARAGAVSLAPSFAVPVTRETPSVSITTPLSRCMSWSTLTSMASAAAKCCPTLPAAMFTAVAAAPLPAAMFTAVAAAPLL